MEMGMELDEAETAALLAALDLQIAWGADEALDEAPLDRTLPRPTAAPAAAAPAATPPAPPAVPARPAAPPAAAFASTALRAGELAAGADSLDALRAALAALDHPLRETAGNLVLADGGRQAG
jgi:hypothetical protein